MDKQEQLRRKAAAWYDNQPTPISPTDLPAQLKQPSSGNISVASVLTSPTYECATCQDLGWLSSGPAVGAGASPTLIECSCGLISRRRTEKEARLKAERAAKYLGELRAALGKLSACTFDSFNTKRVLAECLWNETSIPDASQRKCLLDAAIAARRYAAEPSGWLYLYGPPGAGKSHLAAAIANDLAGNGEPVAYASVPDVLAFVKRGMSDNSADARFDGLLNIDTLILDDLGTENSTAWSVETIFRLIDEREKHSRTTVITSNLHYDNLHPRIASRIAGMVKLIPLLVSDYRRLPQ